MANKDMLSPNRLRQRRQAANMTQQVLADKVGLRQPNVARLEGGRLVDVRVSLASRLARALGCKIEDLLG